MFLIWARNNRVFAVLKIQGGGAGGVIKLFSQFQKNIESKRTSLLKIKAFSLYFLDFQQKWTQFFPRKTSRAETPIALRKLPSFVQSDFSGKDPFFKGKNLCIFFWLWANFQEIFLDVSLNTFWVLSKIHN